MPLLREAFDRGRPDFPPGTPFWRDRSFATLLEHCKQLRALSAFLPADFNQHSYAGQECVEAVESTFKHHGYGHFFYALARTLKPRTCVELGVLQGFSLLSVAAALRDNGGGRIHGLDLFEDYPHRHAHFADVEDHVRACGLDGWSDIARGDAFHAHERYPDLDYLHVDLSNDGDTYRFVFNHWAGKVRKALVLEGGSAERDRVGWMLKHRKPPILPAIEEIRRDHPEWALFVLSPYPSVTVAVRSACLPG